MKINLIFPFCAAFLILASALNANPNITEADCIPTFWPTGLLVAQTGPINEHEDKIIPANKIAIKILTDFKKLIETLLK